MNGPIKLRMMSMSSFLVKMPPADDYPANLRKNHTINVIECVKCDGMWYAHLKRKSPQRRDPLYQSDNLHICTSRIPSHYPTLSHSITLTTFYDPIRCFRSLTWLCQRRSWSFMSVLSAKSVMRRMVSFVMGLCSMLNSKNSSCG